MPEQALLESDAYADRIRDVLASRTSEDGGADGGADAARQLWRALGSAGVLRDLYLPAASREPIMLSPCLSKLEALLTALDSSCPMGLTLSVCVQVATIIPALSAAVPGSPARRTQASALAGEVVGAFAATDAGAAGSDLTALTTAVAVQDTVLRLTGGKRWIVNATIADYAVVLARHRPGPHFTSFTQVLVPTRSPGVRAEAACTSLLAGSGVGHLRFSGVELGRDHVIGRTGQGLPSFADQAATERVAGALWANALARRVLSATYEHLNGRILGGRRLWDNDAIRQRFARSLLEQQRLQALCRRPYPPGASRSQQLLSAMLVKAAAATSLDAVLADCAQLEGAEGFRDDGLQLLRAEAAMFAIAGGTTETMLAGIADHAADLLRTP